MASPTGVDEERSDEEPERSDGNPRKSEQSHFLTTAKNEPKQKVKAMAGKIYFPKPLLAFCGDCVTVLEKRQKKWHLQREFFWSPSYPEKLLFFSVSPWSLALCGTSWPDLRHPHFGEEMGKIRTSRGKNGEDFQYQSANPQTGTCSAGSDILRLLRCRCRKILCRILPAHHPYWFEDNKI